MFVEIQPDHAFLRQVVCVNAPQDVTSDLPHHDLLRRTCCEDPHTGVLIVDGGGETLIPACLSAQINEARFRFESLFIGSGHGQETVVYRHPMIPCPVMGQERKLEVVAHGARVYVWLLRGKISATSPAAEGMPCCQITMHVRNITTCTQYNAANTTTFVHDAAGLYIGSLHGKAERTRRPTTTTKGTSNCFYCYDNTTIDAYYYYAIHS